MSNAVCNAVTQRVSYNVRLSSRPDQTRPESLYRSVVVVSGTTRIRSNGYLRAIGFGSEAIR